MFIVVCFCDICKRHLDGMSIYYKMEEKAALEFKSKIPKRVVIYDAS